VGTARLAARARAFKLEARAAAHNAPTGHLGVLKRVAFVGFAPQRRRWRWRRC
jgi:hypothetical protein